MSRSPFRLSALSWALGFAFPRWATFHMSDVQAAAAPVAQTGEAAPVETATAEAQTAEAQAAHSDEAPATVSVEVPAQHVSLIKRAVALLSKGEQTIEDNIHAGMTMLEGMFGHDSGDSNNV